MKILWLTWKDRSHPLAGGAEVVNEQLAKRLVQQGYEIVFLAGGFSGGAKETEREGFRIERVGGRWSVYYRAWQTYRKKYRDWPDLIIDEINTVPFFAPLYAKQRTLLFVHQLCREIWFYQLFFPLSLIGYLLEPLYLRLLSKTPVVTVSDSTSKDLQKYGFKKEHIHIISEGIEMEPIQNLELKIKNLQWDADTPLEGGRGEFLSLSSPSKGEEYQVRDSISPSPQPSPLWGEGDGTKSTPTLFQKEEISTPSPLTTNHFPLTTNFPTLLILGAMRAMKRTDHAIRAYELAREKIPDLKLVIAGDSTGAYGQRILSQIRNSPYRDSISYLGRVDAAKKKELLLSAHLLLSCAVKEGWGLTVTEANSQGTPAVVYDSDGLRDSVRHGETGIVCKSDPASMAAAIANLLSDPEQYNRLRKNAWEWSKQITFDRSAAEFSSVIASMVK